MITPQQPRLTAISLIVGAITALCGAGEPPRIRILGIAQDGGFPHAACSCERCELARADDSIASGVASLAVIVPDEELGRERVYLIDATPDVRAQLDLLADVRDAEPGRVDRSPVDGVFLTHAHIGHYTGLMFFGFEAVHAQQMPVWCTPRMAAFLRGNGPWSQMVEIGNLDLKEIEPITAESAGKPIDLGGGVTITGLKVPHRDEFADTVGYIIAGPSRRVLYVPDTEPWRTWPAPLVDVIREQRIDLALLDGTFYSADELPGRPASSIGHPLMVDTMELLGPMVEAGEVEVMFIHLNHSNGALVPDSVEETAIKERGFDLVNSRSEIGL